MESIENLNDWNSLIYLIDKIESLRDNKGNAYSFNLSMCDVVIENTNINVIGEAFKLDAVKRAIIEFNNKIHQLNNI